MDEQNQGQTYGTPEQNPNQYYQAQPEQNGYYQAQPEQNGYYQPQPEQGQFYQPPVPAKSLKSKLIAIGAAIAGVVVLIVLCVLIFGHNKPTYPVEFAVDAQYGKVTKMDKMIDGYTNGLVSKELKGIMKLYKKADPDSYEELEDSLKEAKDNLKDKYGSNYKVSVKITEKEKLDKDEVKEYKEDIHSLGKNMLSYAEATDDYDSDDWEDLADSMDLSKSEAKKVISYMESIGKTLKKAKVTEGKTISYTIIIKGSELDEPEEIEKEMDVIKVNGKWVSYSNLYSIMSMATY